MRVLAQTELPGLECASNIFLLNEGPVKLPVFLDQLNDSLCVSDSFCSSEVYNSVAELDLLEVDPCFYRGRIG